jgi:C1A family cysteine protease
MKVAVLVFACIALACAYPESEYKASFGAWKAQHNRTYAGVESEIRYEIFKDNMDKIMAHNADKSNTWSMALNQFADMTQHEFAAKMLGYKGRASDYKPLSVHEYKGEELKATVNWIQKGAVTNVKDQGQCGSCWAFSTCAALEGAVAVAGKPLISFAPQELVDCDKVDSGCNGGLMDNGFNYIKQNGICNWNDYKYTARDGTCKRSQCTAAGHLTGHTDVGTNDNAMMSANNERPLAVAVNAEPWQFYSGGIFSHACSSQLDHGVLAAGYQTSGSAYWLVKNSWGTSWGESGYIRLAKGNNLCGINNAASYPTGVSM